MRAEDSSEALSTATLVTQLPFSKSQQEASNFAALGSLSAQSSQGGETFSQIHSPPRMECSGCSQPVTDILDLRKDIAWASCSKTLDDGIASLLRSRESDTIRYKQMVCSSAICCLFACSKKLY